MHGEEGRSGLLRWISERLILSLGGLTDDSTYPSGSPTTRNAMSTVVASRKISSDSVSTISLVAVMTSRSYNASCSDNRL